MYDTDEQLNKCLHKIMGLCWHITNTDNRLIGGQWLSRCYKCSGGFFKNKNFVNTWEGFGILWEFMQEHERWEDFRIKYFAYNETVGLGWSIPERLTNPPEFAKKVVKFFKAPI